MWFHPANPLWLFLLGAIDEGGPGLESEILAAPKLKGIYRYTDMTSKSDGHVQKTHPYDYVLK